MIRFEANLSEKSLTDLMKKLENHGRKLVAAQRDILDALADYTLERIRYYIVKTEAVDTGRLRDSFLKEVSNDIAKVYTDVFYAKYVEFGTGIRGNNSSHPDIQKYGWVYGTKTGQIAHKFVYNAVLDLEQNYVEIAKDVLRKKGLI